MGRYSVSITNETDETWTVVVETHRTFPFRGYWHWIMGKTVLKPGEVTECYRDDTTGYAITGAVFLAHGRISFHDCRENYFKELMRNENTSNNAPDGRLFGSFKDGGLQEFKIRQLVIGVAELYHVNQFRRATKCSHSGRGIIQQQTINNEMRNREREREKQKRIENGRRAREEREKRKREREKKIVQRLEERRCVMHERLMELKVGISEDSAETLAQYEELITSELVTTCNRPPHDPLDQVTLEERYKKLKSVLTGASILDQHDLQVTQDRNLDDRIMFLISRTVLYYLNSKATLPVSVRFRLMKNAFRGKSEKKIQPAQIRSESDTAVGSIVSPPRPQAWQPESLRGSIDSRLGETRDVRRAGIGYNQSKCSCKSPIPPMDDFLIIPEAKVACRNLSLTGKLDLLEAIMDVIKGRAVCIDGKNLKDKDMKKIIAQGNMVNSENIHFAFPLLKTSLFLQDKNGACCKNIFRYCLAIVQDLHDDISTQLTVLVQSGAWTPISALQLAILICTSSDDTQSYLVHEIQTHRLTKEDIDQSIANKPNFRESRSKINEALKCHVEEKDKDIQAVVDEMKSNGFDPSVVEKVRTILTKIFVLSQDDNQIAANDASRRCKEKIKAEKFICPSCETLAQIMYYQGTVVKQHSDYLPRVTQQAALATTLLTMKQRSGCLLEVSTGEGKSVIIAMLASILAMSGYKVDIITSSQVLAIRDAEEWEEFYRYFDLSCSALPPLGLHTCNSQDEADTMYQAIYSSSIVYGTVSDFAADTLRQEFENRNIKGKRPFSVVIVDEVDYMTLDSGIQLTYLSHNTTGLWYVEQILSMIWYLCSYNQPIQDAETSDILWTTPSQYLHIVLPLLLTNVKGGHNQTQKTVQSVLNGTSDEIANCARKLRYLSGSDHLKKLNTLDASKQAVLVTTVLKKMNSTAVKCYMLQNGTATRYIKKESGCHLRELTSHKLLLTGHGQCCILLNKKSLIDKTKITLEDKIVYSRTYFLENDDHIVIPAFLQTYVQNRLPVFVENALNAIQMTEGREYMVVDGRQRSVSEQEQTITNRDDSMHRFDKVVPIDFESTGVLEKNKRWGDGLQQFLEMKHKLAISPMSTVTNFMSNHRLFQRYLENGYIFGVTGTLGDGVDRAFLQKHFSVNCYSIPTHRQSKLLTLPLEQVRGGRDCWKNRICERVRSIAFKENPICGGQVVLLVCEDLKTAKEFFDKIRQRYPNRRRKVHLYARSDTDVGTVNNKYGQGDVIITTNLGGRGTDYKVTVKVNTSGGLFVLLTFFPRNLRVERQLMGRTARKGNPGSFQMILDREALPKSYQDESIEYLHQKRSEYERRRLEMVEKEHLRNVQVREELFAIFCKELDKCSKNYSAEEKKDVLTMSSKEMSQMLQKRKEHPDMLDYEPAMNALKESWSIWLILNEHLIQTNRHLKPDLQKYLEKESSNLLKGESDNPQNYITQALKRMHVTDQRDCGIVTHYLNAGARFLRAFIDMGVTESQEIELRPPQDDFGTKKLLEKAVKKEPYYKAVALYNKAYVVIKMRQQNYKKEALDILQKASDAIEAYKRIVSNVCVNVSFAHPHANFKAHHGDPNLMQQQQIRSRLIQSWQDMIDKAQEMLKEALKSDDYYVSVRRIAVDDQDTSVNDPLLTDEKLLLHNLGIAYFFQLEKQTGWLIYAKVIAGVIDVLGVVVACLTANPHVLIPFYITKELVKKGVSYMIKMWQGQNRTSVSCFKHMKDILAFSIRVSLKMCPINQIITDFFPDAAMKVVQTFISNQLQNIQAPNVDNLIESAGDKVSKAMKKEGFSVVSEIATKSLKNRGLHGETNEVLKQYKSIMMETIQSEIAAVLDKSLQSSTLKVILRKLVKQLRPFHEEEHDFDVTRRESDTVTKEAIQGLQVVLDRIGDINLPEIVLNFKKLPVVRNTCKEQISIDNDDVRKMVHSLPLKNKLVNKIIKAFEEKLKSLTLKNAETETRTQSSKSIAPNTTTFSIKEEHVYDEMVRSILDPLCQTIAEKVAVALTLFFTQNLQNAILNPVYKSVDCVAKNVKEALLSTALDNVLPVADG